MLGLLAVSDPCPSLDEIASAVGLKGRSGVQRHVNRLIADGYVEHIPGRARDLRVVALP